MPVPGQDCPLFLRPESAHFLAAAPCQAQGAVLFLVCQDLHSSAQKLLEYLKFGSGRELGVAKKTVLHTLVWAFLGVTTRQLLPPHPELSEWWG